MSEETIEKHLSEIFENHLRKFFSKSLSQRLEDAETHFEKIEVGEWDNGQFTSSNAKHFPELKAVVKKISTYLEDEFAEQSDSNRGKVMLNLKERELQRYFSHKWQETFFLLTPLLLTTFFLFDSTGSVALSKESRDEMLNEFGLNSAKKRRDFCLKYLTQLLSDQKVTHGGGKESLWDKDNRLQFLAHFERFKIVIKTAKAEYKSLSKKNTPAKKILEQIQEKYEIPKDKMNFISNRESDTDTALEWAKLELGIESDNKGLRDRVLKQANAENKIEKPYVIIGVAINDKGTRRFVINAEDKNQRKKLRYVLRDIPPEPNVEVW
jgi:hypothetical protein